jgi:hypothetical protein
MKRWASGWIDSSSRNAINGAGDLVAGDHRRLHAGVHECAPNTIAGIPIPDTTLASNATQFVHDVSTQLLFDHSRRVFPVGLAAGREAWLDYDPELLYIGAMFRDIGLVEGHRSEHERFEIDGANAARAFLERHGLPELRLVTLGVEATLPGYVRANFCEYIKNPRFET